MERLVSDLSTVIYLIKHETAVKKKKSAIPGTNLFPTIKKLETGSKLTRWTYGIN